MHPPRRLNAAARLSFLILTLAPLCAVAQQPASAPSGAVLVPQIVVDRPLANVGDPLWVRFLITNNSDAPVELPFAADTSDALGLPVAAVFGTPAEPACFLGYNAEKPAPVAAPKSAPAGGAGLKLAPRASLGLSLNLRDLAREARYVGDFRLEWRPLGGAWGVASVSIRVEPRKDAILVTDHGKITFKLFYDKAPRNVENFLDLARAGFYNGKDFHRVIPGFAAQGGSPSGDSTGTRSDGKLIPAEFHDHPFDLGTLAMARKPDSPNSASCQFFIALGRTPDLDGQYTAIGHADDEESIRTLRLISGLPTDRKQKPLHPLVIRSITLVDQDTSSATVHKTP